MRERERRYRRERKRRQMRKREKIDEKIEGEKEREDR